MTSDQDVESALATGPADTRGGIRGLCIRRFPDQIKSVQWERIQFSGGLLPRTLEMGDLFVPEAVQSCAQIFAHATSPMDALDTWNSGKDS